MAKVLVSGTVFRAPETTTLKNGELCVTAIIECRETKYGNRTRFWHVAAVSTTVQSALMHLSLGDTVIVQGTVKAAIHERNGEFVLSFGVIAERVLNVPALIARTEGRASAEELFRFGSSLRSLPE
jgi:single-stranded DNA-binding protein